MKNIIIVIIFLLSCTLFGQAQSPQAFSYQAVVRDINGNTINNQLVAFRISILATSPSGTAVYSETHTATTNNFGLVNLMIGNGTVASGNFSSISWGNDEHFVQVELDATGGTNYTIMGTTQLLSVPYALHAATSGDQVWEKVGNRAQHAGGTISVGTTPTTSAITIEGIGNSNSLIRGLKDGRSMFLVNTFNQHPFIELYDINGNTDLVHLDTRGDSYLNGGKLGLGTRTPLAALDIQVPAVTGQEIIQQFKVSDAPADDYLRFINSTNNSGKYVPGVFGHRVSDNTGALYLTGAVAPSQDNGNNAVVHFTARRTSSPILNRPLFSWHNYDTYNSNLMTMSANGNLGIGTTTPARKLHVTEAMRLEPSATAPSNPSAGDMYFSSTTNKLMVYDGTTWQACW